MRPSAKKPRLLFATYMAGGNATIIQNLQDEIGPRADVDSAWLRIEMDADSKDPTRSQRRRFIPGTIRNSLVTGRGIRELESAGGAFDAAYFFQQSICMLLWRFRRRVPYVIAMDGTPLYYAKNELWYAQPRFDPTSLASRAKREVLRRLYQGAHHLLPLSNGCRESLIEDYGANPERITVVPPGIDLVRFSCPDRESTAPTLATNALFVGADFKRKGGDLLIQLAARPEFSDLQFHVVTRHFSGSLPPNVHVHANVSNNSVELLTLLRQADFFLLPTLADSYSNASAEAMAMGLPVITTPIGGIVDQIVEGQTGFLVNPGDLAGLADRIRLLRDDRDLRLRLGQAGRQRAEELFDGRKLAKKIVSLLMSAAGTRASRT